jgi:hypothetical protein
MRWNGLVTGETSVVHSQCIAVGLFSEQLTVTTDIASPLSGNGTEFREICYTGSPLHYVIENISCRAVRKSSVRGFTEQIMLILRMLCTTAA